MTNLIEYEFVSKICERPILLIIVAFIITNFLCCGGNMFKVNDKDE